MKILLLIPAFNEERYIRTLVERARRHVPDLLVIDDGSRDRTASEAAQGGATVFRIDSNLGKGEALKKGFEWALEHGYDFIITMDGDGQHDPDDIPHFFPLLDSFDLILGNRMSDRARVPWLRRFSNRAANLLVSFFASQAILDSQTGFRAYRAELLRRIPLYSSKYDLETEVVLKAARRGFRIRHCRIRTIYADEVSRFRTFFDSARFLATIVRCAIWR